MKKLFRKVATIAGSALMIGSSVAMAAAASYPAPFVSGGAADVAVVYGSAGANTDAIAAFNVQTDLATELAAQTAEGGSVSASTVSGEAVSLASGSDLMYLNDDLGENKQTLTKTDLANVLADGTFTNDAGTDYDYEQKITVSQNAGNAMVFGNSDSDIDDPAVLVELTNAATTAPLSLTVTFDTAVNLTHADSEGQEIALFGKSYTVGTSTDTNTLVLLGGADESVVNVGETASLQADGDSYEVTLNGISDAATSAEASVTVNGVSKTFTEGQTKSMDGVDVYVKTIFRTADNQGYIELQIGADKLTLEHGSEVKEGSDNDGIDGTLVYLIDAAGAGGTPVDALTSLTISVFPEDSEGDHILVGGSWTDPVFGSVKIDFGNLVNGPVFTAEQDTGRTKLSLKKAGNRELNVELVDSAGNSASSLPLMYNKDAADDDGDDIVYAEGATIADEEYFILNSGDNEHFMRMTKIDCNDGSSSVVEMKDLITGDNYDFTADFTDGESVSIDGQTYSIKNVSATTVNITSSDIATKKAVFPYIELVSGEDYPRVAWVNFTTDFSADLGDNITATTVDTAVEGLTYDLPTGTAQFRVTNETGNANNTAVEVSVDGSSTWTNLTTVWTADGTVQSDMVPVVVGKATYLFGLTTVMKDAGIEMTVVNASIDANFTTVTGQDSAGEVPKYPGLLFVENEDKSDSDNKHAVYLNMTDDGTYAEANTPLFSGTQDTNYNDETWDDSDLTGYLTNWGTYVLADNSDTNQHLVSLTYPEDQMYGEIFVGEDSATITGGAISTGSATQLGQVAVEDSETSSYSGKNLVVVGGSCINSVAADLLGEPACGADFTALTDIAAGEALIKSYDKSGKVALLVAGYNAADTTKAVTYLTNNNVDTAVGSAMKVTSATSATAITASA